MTTNIAINRQKHADAGKVGVCKGCGASVLWLISPHDKLTPVDLTPTPRGNVRIDLEYGVWLMILEPDLVPPSERYVVHFATCPKAGEFRRRG